MSDDRARYAALWSRSHGGIAARGLVGAWLALVHRLAEPLVRRAVPPDAVTLVGLLLACVTLVPGVLGGRWALAVAALAAASGLLDGLDGALARLAGRTSAWGAVLDAGSDRVADAALVAALYLLGAPGWLSVVAAGVGALHEYLRARAAAVGGTEVAALTIAERPSRVIIVVMFALACGIYPQAGRAWAGGGALALALTGAVGLVQLLIVIRRRLR